MRKSFILIAMMVAVNAWALTQKDGVYQIGTCQDLKDFSDLVNTKEGTDSYPNAGANAELTADIDMTTCGTINPIGAFRGNDDNTFTNNNSSNNFYSGHFAGNGHIISNLIVLKTRGPNIKVDGSTKEAYYAGLFGRVKEGVIEDVIVYNLKIDTKTNKDSYDYVGGIVGWLDNGSVLNCTIAGNSEITGRRNVGGVVGRAEGGTIKDCLSNVQLSSTGRGANVYVGGICGYASATTQLSSSVYVGSQIVRACVITDSCFCDEGGTSNEDVCKRDGTIIPHYSYVVPPSNAVYPGAHEYAIAGGDSLNVVDCYYDSDINPEYEENLWVEGDKKNRSMGMSDVNTAENICKLNEGTWSSSTCTGDDGPWTENGNITNHAGLQLNSDGTITIGAIFDANGGSFGSSGTSVTKWLNLGDDISAPNTNPTRTGYTFVGWGASNDATTPVTSFGTASGTKTFYALWSANSYTIVFNSNGGSEVASITADFGTTISAPDAPTMDGYVFGGWYSDATFTSAFTFSTMPAAEEGNTITLYAKWNQKYNLMIEVAEGTPALPDVANAYAEGELVTLVYPRLLSGFEDFFKFDHWEENYDDVTIAEDHSFTMPAHDVAVYAVYSPLKTRILYERCVECDVSYQVDIDYGTEYTVKDASFDSAGYTQTGWAIEEGGAKVYDLNASVTFSDAMVRLFPVWTLDTYTITYKDGDTSLDGENNGGNPLSYNINSETIELNALGLKDISDVSNAKKFTGWYASSDFTGNPVTEISSGSIGDMTLYAKYETVYQVGYFLNGGQGRDWYFPGEPIRDIKPEGTQNFYCEWFLNSGDHPDTIPTHAPASNDLYEVCYADYPVDIVFDPNGGAFANPSYTGGKEFYGVDIDLSKFEVPELSREGYRFLGWSRSSDASAPDYSFGKVDNPTGVTFYAVWKRVYTVTFDKNGHGDDVTAQVVDSLDKATKPDNLAATGYEFGGWFVDGENFTTEYDFNTSVESDLTLHAKWSATVSFDMNGYGTQVESQKVIVGKTATIPTVPTAEGFLFSGWYTDDSFAQEFDFAAPVTAAIELHAKWLPAVIITIDATSSKKYNGEEQTIGYTVENLPEGYHLVCNASSTNVTASSVDVTCDKIADAEGHDVTSQFGLIFTDDRKTGALTIGQATENTVIVSLDDWTYGSTSVPTPDVSATFHAEGEPAVVYAKKGADTTKAESWSATVPTDAGEYYVKATVAGTDNYVGGGATAEFSITAKGTEGFVVTFSPESATYTGDNQTPTITVKDGDNTLTVGKDYTVTWSETPNAAGTYTATVTGAGNYTGTKTGSFTVGKDEVATTNVSIEGWTYGETAKTPVADGIGASTATFEYAKKGADTTKAENWSVTAPTDAGEYIVRATIAGTDNYAAKSGTAEFTIGTKSSEGFVVTFSPESATYTGNDQTPTITVKDGETTLTAGKDYTVTWSETPNAAGTYTATVTGAGNYTGTKTGSFTVGKDEVATTNVTIEGWTYGETAKTPVADGIGASTATFEYAKKDADTTKAENWSATAPTEAGEYIVRATIVGTDNYVAKIGTAEFSITAKSSEGFVVTFSPESATYTGNDQTPTITVKDGETTLTAGKDYTVTWSATPNAAGTYTATVTYIGDYSGTKTAEFTISKDEVATTNVTIEGWTYGETAKTPVADGIGASTATFEYAKKGEEPAVWSATAPTEAGEYIVRATIVGTDNYVAKTGTAEFTIAAKSSEGFVVTFDPASATYTGNDQTPTVTVKDGETTLTAGKDYTVTWSETPNAAGTYTATVTYIGDYSGTKTGSFTISKDEVATTNVSIEGWTYGETAKTPVADGIGASTATFEYAKKGTDPLVWSSDVPTEAGEYIVRATIVGTDNYAAKSGTAEFTIGTKSSEGFVVTFSPESATYTGNDQTPTITVKDGETTLTAGKDYTVAWSETPNAAGTYTATVTGKGDYSGTKTAEFTISKDEVATTNVSIEGWTYGEASKTPVADGIGASTATFEYAKKGTDPLVWSSDVPTEAGEYYVKATIAGTDNYVAKTGTAEFTIAAKSSEGFVVTFSPESATYTGDNQTPTVTVKDGETTLTAGKDYTVTWSETPNAAGTYTATVTGKGDYSGTKTGSFTVGKDEVATTNVTIEGWTYGETAKTPVADGIGASTATFEYAKKGEEPAAWSATAPTEAGEYIVRATIAGTDNYVAKTGTAEFTIDQREVQITWSDISQAYTGATLVPTATITNLVGSDACGLTLSDGVTDAGSGTVTVVGLDNPNYKLPSTAPSTTFTVTKATENAVSVSLDDWTYGSTSVPTPDVSATFHAENEPVVKYAKKDADTTKAESWSATVPTDAGEYYVKATVAGTDNYVGGGATAEFSITAKSTEGFVVTFDPASATYTGNDQTPTVTVKDGETTLTADKDYTVTWSETPNAAGTYTATVTGKGDYSGKKTAEFTVGPKSVSEFVVSVNPTNFVYTGSALTPTITVKDGDNTLTVGTDYTVSGLENVVGVGSYEVTVSGTGNYKETATATFTVSPVITMSLGDGETLACTEGAKGFAACNAAHDNIVHVYGTATAELPDAEKSGWTFAGWYDNASFANAKIESIAADRVDGLTLYPKFVKEITIVYGEGAGDKLQVEIELDDSEEDVVKKVEAALAAAGVSPTKTDDSDSTYAFDKWNVDGDTWTAEFKGTVKTEEIVVVYGADPTKDTIHVTVDVPDNAETRLAKVDADLEKKGVSPTKAEDSDSTYAFDKWNVDGDTWTAEFKGSVKTEEIVVVYGADPTKDTIHVTVDVPDNAETRIAKVEAELEKKGVSPTKADDSDSTYAFDKWNVDGDTWTAEFKATPKYIEVVVGEDTVKVIVPKGESGEGSDPSGEIAVDVVLVVDGDTVKTVVKDGDVLDSIARDTLGHNPTKAETKDSTYEFAGWEPVVDDEGKPVVDKNGNVIYEPVFESEVKKDTIRVVTDDGDTVEVVIHVPDSDEQVQQKIGDEFKAEDIPLPTKDSDVLYSYKFDKFVKNVETGLYEASFKKLSHSFTITYKMPKRGVLLEDVLSYNYGEETILPQARIEGDDEWEFKGWYTKRDGLGDRSKKILSTDDGDKVFYPLFQKPIAYEINGKKGVVMIIYTEEEEKYVNRALESIIPEDYEKKGVTMTFDKWVLEDGVYVAKFTQAVGFKTALAPRFTVNVIDRVLEINGARMGAKIDVFDMRGRLVSTSLVQNGTTNVEIAKSGSYIVRVDRQAHRVDVR